MWLGCCITWDVSANWFSRNEKVCSCHICSYLKISLLQDRCYCTWSVCNAHVSFLEKHCYMYWYWENLKTTLKFFLVWEVFIFSRKFKRVLELPSENWLELAQDWCCHGTSHLTSVAGVLEPGEKDCFVGEYYIKLHSSTLQPGTLQILPVSKK